jgi:hypothetical protein
MTMKKIYTFHASITTDATASVEAETLLEAQRKVKELDGADCLDVNIEVGSGGTELDVINGFEDKAPDDGTHYWQTPRQNAMENETALQEISVE